MSDTLVDAAPAKAPPQQLRPVAVVVNGKAGAMLDQPGAAEAFANIFAEAGLKPHFIPPEAGPLPQRIRLARETGHAMVIVAGGDGTVACAAQTLVGGDVPLGILPFGTMNLLAKDLGIPVGDAAAAVRVLATGVERSIDVAEVNGQVFLCGSMLGIPTRLARFREAQRGRGLRARVGGWVLMARAGMRYLRRYLPRRLELRVDDETAVLRVPSLTVTSNLLDDTAGRLFARRRLDGGELGIYIVTRMTLGDVARLAVRFMRGAWRRDPVMIERRADHLEIRTRTRRRLRVMNDGEVMLMEAPLHYRIRPRALRVLAPAAPHQ